MDNASIINGGVSYTQNVRLRSANRGNANNTWNVNSNGNVNNNNATNSNRFAPDCVLYDAKKPVCKMSGHPQDTRN